MVLAEKMKSYLEYLLSINVKDIWFHLSAFNITKN